MTKKGHCELCKCIEQDESKYGKMFSDENITVHLFCLLFGPGLPQNGEDHEGFDGFLLSDILKEAKRVKKIKCFYCNNNGANLGCCVKSCKHVYHTNCALENNVSFEFTSEFKTFCQNHKKVTQKEEKKLEPKCGICYEKLKKEYPKSILIPCCKNSWFHKICLQKYALSAGIFFKCPLCGSKDVSEQLKILGIFVPERDAAWELEDNAYSEFSEPIELTCENKYCWDKKKDSDKEYNWKLCQFCGFGGIHAKCYFGEIYTCNSCYDVLSKSGDPKVKKLRRCLLPFESDASSSDEDNPTVYNHIKF